MLELITAEGVCGDVHRLRCVRTVADFRSEEDFHEQHGCADRRLHGLHGRRRVRRHGRGRASFARGYFVFAAAVLYIDEFERVMGVHARAERARFLIKIAADAKMLPFKGAGIFQHTIYFTDFALKSQQKRLFFTNKKQ